jgi:imidazolonepropionase-like amidohydrolase
MRTRRALILAALAVGPLAVALSALAQDAQRGAAKTQPKAAPVAAKTGLTAVVGADILTVTQGVVRNGVVLMQDGKILRVGSDVAVPKEATVIDATGKIVTPGLVGLNVSGIGMGAGGGGGRGGRGGGGGGRGGGASDRLVDSLNPFDRNIKFALATGITTACLEIGGAGGGRGGGAGIATNPDEPPPIINDDGEVVQTCPCCGLAIVPTQPITPVAPTGGTARRHAVLKMAYGDVGSMLMKDSAAFYHMPASGLTGALNRHRWRETVHRAKEAAKAQEDAEAPAQGTRAADDISRLVKKEIPLRTEASSIEQVRDMIALAKELDYNLVLDGVHEGWLVADELAAAHVTAVIRPRERRAPLRDREDTSGSSIELSGKLEKVGVPFAVVALSNTVSMDGVGGPRDLTSLVMEAAFAVRGGASEANALAALTIVPARIMGIADRVGSIEEGKDADLLILTGQPLDYHTFVDKAIVGGKVYYDRGKDKLYENAGK